MPTAARLARWQSDTVYWSQPTAGSAAGTPTWSSPTQIACRIDKVRRRVTGPSGETYQWVDVVMTTSAITEGDRIWPPGADQTDATQAVRLGRVDRVRSRPVDTTVVYQAELGGV